MAECRDVTRFSTSVEAARGVAVMDAARPATFTIPSSDAAFREHVARVLGEPDMAVPEALEGRLRRIFPRVVVRERTLSGETPRLYIYRDGAWSPSGDEPWWEAPNLPRMTVSLDGWITSANPGAQSLLGLDASAPGTRHFTDFVAPGTLQDALGLFAIIDAGHDLNATVALRPASGDLIAVDLRAVRVGGEIVGVFRLADDVEIDARLVSPQVPEVICVPEQDAAFRGYVERVLTRMPEPTPEGLALRLRRLYPHARVETRPDTWVAARDALGAETPAGEWWHDATLPRVRYDAQALILEANDAAVDLIGHPMVGHYWQEFVTPGTTEQVAAMLEILAATGSAESRFRMPGAGGELVEFDSYTEVDGENMTTTMRRRP